MENLLKNAEFQKVYNFGRKIYGFYSLVFVLKNNLEYNRCGFVASKKIGNAVCRNRIKRLFREYYRGCEENIEKGYDIIFVGKKNAGEKYKELKFQEMKKDLDKVFTKAKLFKD